MTSSGGDDDDDLDVAGRLRAELHRRGLTDAEIAATVRKRRRRKQLEFDIVHARRQVTPEELRARLGEAPRDDADRARPGELCTVEEAAERLRLHPKTVLRFISDGRLEAKRVGRAYRIRRTDLEALAGLPPTAAAPAAEASATIIVDAPDIGPSLARRWSRALTPALRARAPRARAELIYDPERSQLKVLIVGPPGEALGALGLVQAWLAKGPD
jgi:excisionase family DNA binding protein